LIVVANGEQVEIHDGATIADLLAQLGLTKRLIVVEHNGEALPRAAAATTVLAAGDRLELVRAVAGG
jgi:sulfur carrier protein